MRKDGEGKRKHEIGLLTLGSAPAERDPGRGKKLRIDTRKKTRIPGRMSGNVRGSVYAFTFRSIHTFRRSRGGSHTPGKGSEISGGVRSAVDRVLRV